ncbi:MAG TPA: hypothetical protein PLW44_00355 [Chitinophagales bacterium]|nr:hypothetical protein [Chitinophagales bacterium]
MLLVFSVPLKAENIAQADSTINLFESEKTILLQRVSFEKNRIANDYRSADSRLFNLVDSVSNYILQLDIPVNERNQYLNRLQLFLTNINRYYSDSYLKSGTYLAVLSYYPVMIEWDQKDELLRNIKRYSAFSVKAARLIPSDTIAEDFLTDYLTDHPDDIFRYTEEFDDRNFALRLLEKAVKLAPESAKRYYSNNGPVSNILRRSRDPFVRKSFEIYSRFGQRSHAFLLLDNIVYGNMPLEVADSIGNNADQLFKLLVQLSMKYESNVTYSIYRYLNTYSVDAMRKVNQESLNPSYTFESFKKRTPEEMFVLLSYGYKETTAKTFQLLLELLKKRSTEIPISSVMIASLDKQKLKELIIHCDKNQMLDKILGLVDDEKKDYLLALSSLEEKEDLFPPLRPFIKDNPLTNNEPVDRVMNEINKTQPARTIVPDVAEEEKPIERPEKMKEWVEPKKIAAVSGANPVGPVEVVPSEENADAVPVPAPEPEPVPEPVKIQLDERTRTLLGLKKNILNTLSNFPQFIEKDYSEEMLNYAAQKEPDELLKKIDAYKHKRFSLKILEQCAINAPLSIKRYLYNPNHPVNFILQYSKNPVVKKILEINPELGYHSKPLLLMDDIVKRGLTTTDAIAVSTDANKLFSAMTRIISQQDYIGGYSINREMRDYSLRFIREINDKIATGATQPFYSVEGFGSTELYFLMLYGRDEVFTSTFNGLFERFMKKLPAQDGEAFMRSVNNNQFRDFISLCSNFGTIKDFMSTFTAEGKADLFTAYTAGLEKQYDNLSGIILIAESASNINDNQLLTLLQSNIKREYERVMRDSNQVGISIYGVLSSIIAGNAQTETNWYKTVSKQFRIAPVASLASTALFSNKGHCVEQMYFYNDDDGRSSYINFINTYKNQSNWVVDDRNSYVRIYSQQGKTVEIFANKPEFEENGISAIEAYFKENNYIPTVIVHRGHSFHTESTLEKVPASARLIFVGSCGGFYKLPIALENAPEAHIISTKQIGTKSVNDVMIYSLNENIRNGKDIVWNDFWGKMRDKLSSNQYFGDYIPPNKNLGAIFIRAYYKILGV